MKNTLNELSSLLPFDAKELTTFEVIQKISELWSEL